jgi:hypothetical protein
MLPVIHFALFFLGYYRLRDVMEKLIPLHLVEESQSETRILQRAQEIARIVSIAAHHGLYKATCLRRSLLVWAFLRGNGIRGRICFGVRKIEDRLEAHAWVEHNGSVINDSAMVHEHYQALEEVLPLTTLGL